MAKYLLCSCIVFVMLSGCGVPQQEYNALKAKCDSLTNVVASMKTEVASMAAEIDELRHGEARIAGLAKNSYASGDYVKMKYYIGLLKEKHPESGEIQHFDRMMPDIEKKIAKRQQELEKKRKDSIRLANINNTGIWSIHNYVDDFGESTKDKYVYTVLDGKFSNSATTDSDLKVQFIIDGKSIRIQLYEYARNHPIKGEGTIIFKIKDSKGRIHEIESYNNDKGNNNVNSEDRKLLRTILLAGGQIRFSAVASNFGVRSEYRFTINNADYLDNALRKAGIN